ncbi:MAG TPA: toxin-antitoxin system HicB family antitoxin [Novosphingobium sp.]|nr:toxin-antitoxin system HicB family antitoxin [Novosphingobium sp.]
MPAKPSAPGKKAFPLRLDPVLFAALERAAAADIRSVNAEIECLLREALGRRGIKVSTSATPRRGRPPKQGDE